MMNFDFDFKNRPRRKDERDDPYALFTDKVVSAKLYPDGHIAYYKIIGELSSTESFGYSYAAFQCDSNGDSVDTKPVFIKAPRIKKDLPNHLRIRDYLGGVGATFQREYDNRHRIRELNGTTPVAANIIARGDYTCVFLGNKEIELDIPFLVQEYINELSLEEFFTSELYKRLHPEFLQNGKGKFIGITDPKIWFQLAESIIDIVRRVHNRQIVHGELVPKNILLRMDGDKINPILVDFGQSFQLDTAAVEDERAKSTSRYLAPECREPHVQFYTPADIYSLGGVLYFLVTGSPPPDILERQDIFPSEKAWASANQDQTDQWKNLIHDGFKSNGGLMKRNEGIVKIIDKCMRPRTEDRYSSAEKVLQALNAVNYDARRAMNIRLEIKKVFKEWCKMEKRNQKEAMEWPGVFTNIVGDKLELLFKELADMDKGHYEIYGEREDIIDTLIKYIGVLKPGDSYVTVTVPDYWTEENLGVNGRFLTVNKDLVRNGVFVHRLFLIAEEDLKAEQTRRILNAHLEAWGSLEPDSRLTAPDFPSHPTEEDVAVGKMYIGVRTDLSKEKIRDFQQNVSHVDIWSNAKTGKKMSIMFALRPKYGERDGELVQTGSQVVKVRFRALSGPYEYDQLVDMFTDKAHALCEVVAKLKGTPPEANLD